jgi:FlaA1/EpsC-like NDP-sugar epimerase
MTQATVKTLLIGAGEAGVGLLHDLSRHPENPARIACIIDDSPQKWGTNVLGFPVMGGRDEILRCVREYGIENIIFAIPSAEPCDRKAILNICRQAPCVLKTLPSLSQFVDPHVNIRLVRDVNFNDLLGRKPSGIDLVGIFRQMDGKTVLVTGGGGSIGSELCRQLAAYPIRKLIIFDSYENAAYDIQQELLAGKPDLPLETLIGSVRDSARLEHIFAVFRPEIIFHAAAHKHVPLMESSPHEAVKNNVFGTWNLALLADKYKAETFLLVSTDKAVNPTNIMGASKRICEMIVQTRSSRSSTKFVAVRFGNVLGSNGSVIPLFQRQIACGGPVTVTHPEVTRFFMTIPEAVSLVLSASACAKGGEIFILDMGEPVKILDMADKLIRLSGLMPERDIKIVFTGLRPGEKLYEEILLNEEGLNKTDNKKIFVAAPLHVDVAAFSSQLEYLYALACDEQSDIRAAIRRIVPAYRTEQ